MCCCVALLSLAVVGYLSDVLLPGAHQQFGWLVGVLVAPRPAARGNSSLCLSKTLEYTRAPSTCTLGCLLDL